MLVSHRKQFIYTKTFKTAGTSVEVYFEPYCLPAGNVQITHYRQPYIGDTGIVGSRGSRRDPISGEVYEWFNHMPAQLIQQQVGQKIWNQYFKFCVIRNPFDKLISAFYFFEERAKQQGLSVNLSAIQPLRFETPDAFLKEIAEKKPEERFRNWLRRGGSGVDRDKYLINNQVCVDFFIRYEHLQADLQYVCDRLDIPFEPDRLPQLKAGLRPKHTAIDEYYDKETLDLVLDQFRFEIEYFSYLPPTKFIPELLFFFKDTNQSLQEQNDSLIETNRASQAEILHLQGESKAARSNVEKYTSELDISKEYSASLKNQVGQLQKRIRKSQRRLNRTKGRLRQKIKRKNAIIGRQKEKIAGVQAELDAVRSSKFWKLRSLWLRCKRPLGFKAD